jgi:hypothetical protein
MPKPVALARSPGGGDVGTLDLNSMSPFTFGRVEGRRGSFRSRGVAVAGGFRQNADASILT